MAEPRLLMPCLNQELNWTGALISCRKPDPNNDENTVIDRSRVRTCGVQGYVVNANFTLPSITRINVEAWNGWGYRATYGLGGGQFVAHVSYHKDVPRLVAQDYINGYITDEDVPTVYHADGTVSPHHIAFGLGNRPKPCSGVILRREYTNDNGEKIQGGELVLEGRSAVALLPFRPPYTWFTPSWRSYITYHQSNNAQVPPDNHVECGCPDCQSYYDGEVIHDGKTWDGANGGSFQCEYPFGYIAQQNEFDIRLQGTTLFNGTLWQIKVQWKTPANLEEYHTSLYNPAATPQPTSIKFLTFPNPTYYGDNYRFYQDSFCETAASDLCLDPIRGGHVINQIYVEPVVENLTFGRLGNNVWQTEQLHEWGYAWSGQTAVYYDPLEPRCISLGRRDAPIPNDIVPLPEPNPFLYELGPYSYLVFT